MNKYIKAFLITYLINLIGMCIILYFELFKLESFLMGAILMAQTIKLSEYIHNEKQTS